ncbi:MAG: hypothetical protein MRERV_8c032 [Mycoplasmataceae bacterium RV_VA103A]|nr:MAG: hypothetical protein MRERV_8c032 [Mycoplasmataceae bacterium RV_VA103A]
MLKRMVISLKEKNWVKKEISYSQGRGHEWKYKNQKISIHQLEAYLVYFLFLQSQSQM